MVRIPVSPSCPNCGGKMNRRTIRADYDGGLHKVLYSCPAGRCRTRVRFTYNQRTWRTGSAASGDLDVHWD